MCRVAPQHPQHSSGQFTFLGIEFDWFVSVPLLHELAGPGECFVEVTEVAGIGLHGVADGQHFGRLDAVNANGGEQGVGGVWHVAVVALAARGSGGVVSVLGEAVAGEFGMALHASPIASHAGGQLGSLWCMAWHERHDILPWV